MKQIIVFHSAQWSDAAISPYEDVTAQANAWLRAHPHATILDSHTNMTAETNWTEFCLTLIVELAPKETA